MASRILASPVPYVEVPNVGLAELVLKRGDDRDFANKTALVSIASLSSRFTAIARYTEIHCDNTQVHSSRSTLHPFLNTCSACFLLIDTITNVNLCLFIYNTIQQIAHQDLLVP